MNTPTQPSPQPSASSGNSPPTKSGVSQALSNLAQRELSRRDLLAFLPLFWDELTFGWFHRLLADALADFVKGVESKSSPRLIIEAPPRHGKSLLTTRGFIPWVLGNHPEWDTVAACATQELADYFGREMRRIINSPDYLSIFPGARPDLGSNAVDHLVTQRGGGYWLAGVGSQLTGVGAHVLVGDDLIKSREVAESELEMSRIWDWFNSVAMTRLSPGGGVILMNTRWSPNDLAGRVLQADTKGRWKRLSFPALAVNEERSRRIGEPLHPERYTLEMLEEIRDQLIANGKEREWLALYQQSPVNIQGDFFKAEGLVYVPLAEFPKTDDLYWYIGTDFAASVDSRADDTALIPVGIDSEGNGYCPPDAVVEKLSILDSVERLLDLCEKYHPLWVAMEKGVLNSAIKPILAKRMSERGVYVTIKEITRSQGKHIYAAPVQARMQAKKVRFARTDLYMLKIAPSFLNFSPGATNQYDDPVDAISNIYMTLEGIVAPGPKVPEKEQSEEDIDDEMWEKILSRMRGKDAVPFAKFNGEKYAQKKEVVS